MRIPVVSRIAGLPLRTRWIVISVILLCGVELILALVLSASWVKDAPHLLMFADKIKRFAPVVGNFDQVARYPEGVRVFLAITICLLPLKILVWSIYWSREEDDSKVSLWNVALAIFMAIFFLFYTLTHKGEIDGPRSLFAQVFVGIKSGNGALLWFSWSIVLLSADSLIVSWSLLIIWKKCISVFHNLKGRKNE
jgi:hypothetical protein